MNVLRAHIAPHPHGDQGKRVTAIYCGSSGSQLQILLSAPESARIVPLTTCQLSVRASHRRSTSGVRLMTCDQRRGAVDGDLPRRCARRAAAHLTPPSTTRSTSTTPARSTSKPSFVAKDTARCTHQPPHLLAAGRRDQIRSAAKATPRMTTCDGTPAGRAQHTSLPSTPGRHHPPD